MTDGEWSIVASGNAALGSEVRSATAGWNTAGSNFNQHGFSAVPGGRRKSNGTFLNINYMSYFIQAIESSATYARLTYVSDNSDIVNDNDYLKTDGVPFRCTRNW
jgi:uncharacterized protein (TIGR02145 family)